MSNMLGINDIRGTLADLMEKLGSEKGSQIHKDLKKLLRGELEFLEIVVDLDAKPYIPDGWKIEKHVPGGKFTWDADAVKFHLDAGQLNGGTVRGEILRECVKGLKPFNATLLDWLLARQYLIPENWKKDAAGNERNIYFWGTTYRRPDGRISVRCLYWDDEQWYSGSDWLDGGWDAQNPAAVSAS